MGPPSTPPSAKIGLRVNSHYTGGLRDKKSRPMGYQLQLNGKLRIPFIAFEGAVRG
jgi:hypothetical protein